MYILSVVDELGNRHLALSVVVVTGTPNPCMFQLPPRIRARLCGLSRAATRPGEQFIAQTPAE
jgi:hypothetical protein